MGTVVFTSPRTLWVLGLKKLPFPFIFHGNVLLQCRYIPYACHYNPRFEYFKSTFLMSKTFFQGVISVVENTTFRCVLFPMYFLYTFSTQEMLVVNGCIKCNETTAINTFSFHLCSVQILFYTTFYYAQLQKVKSAFFHCYICF